MPSQVQSMRSSFRSDAFLRDNLSVVELVWQSMCHVQRVVSQYPEGIYYYLKAEAPPQTKRGQLGRSLAATESAHCNSTFRNQPAQPRRTLRCDFRVCIFTRPLYIARYKQRVGKCVSNNEKVETYA